MSSIQFKNNSATLPILISTWVAKSPGVSKYEDTLVPPNTEVTLYSSVGEWMVGSLFYDKAAIQLWKNAGLECDSMLAKFRNKPCASGNYAWRYTNAFDIAYTNGVVTWQNVASTEPSIE